MITKKNIIICKELTDIVDDILHDNVKVLGGGFAFPENEHSLRCSSTSCLHTTTCCRFIVRCIPMRTRLFQPTYASNL